MVTLQRYTPRLTQQWDELIDASINGTFIFRRCAFCLEQLIFAVSGVIEFVLENVAGDKLTFILDKPNIGLYIPKMFWRTIKLSHNAVLLCLASKEFEEADYIRNYDQFKQLMSEE